VGVSESIRRLLEVMLLEIEDAQVVKGCNRAVIHSQAQAVFTHCVVSHTLLRKPACALKVLESRLASLKTEPQRESPER
jgi:hypothetical protein